MKITTLIKSVGRLFTVLKTRCKATTPIFFKNVIRIGVSVSAIAIAVHVAVSSAGANEPQWWLSIYPYLVGIPAGMVAIAKLTKEDK